MIVKRIYRFIFIFILSAATFAVVHLEPVEQQISVAQVLAFPEKIPKEVEACIPREARNTVNQKEKPQIYHPVPYKGLRFYRIDMLYRDVAPFDGQESREWYSWGRFGFVVDSNGCMPLNGINSSNLLQTSLIKIFPEEVAQQLALQRWQYVLSQFKNKEALRKDIIEGLKPGPYRYYLYSEDLLALQKLGIIIPQQILNKYNQARDNGVSP